MARRWTIAIACVLLLVSGVAARGDAQCIGTSGRVVDRLTGAPIVGARVVGGRNSSAVTNADGCFTLDSVYTEDCVPTQIDCAYSFGVSANGYVPYGEEGYLGGGRFYANVRLATIAAALCSGDCEGDHAVGIDELLCAVDAMLTNADSGCVCADRDGDGLLDIAEALTAVRNALGGCVDCGPGAPTICEAR